MKISKSIFFVIFFFLQVILYSQSDTIRFAWMSDTHIGEPTAAEDLRSDVKDINSLKGIDFTIISGDIGEMGTDDQLKLAKQILDSLNSKYYIIPGNHDCKWSESGATFFPKLWGNDKFVFNYGKYLFIGMHEGPILKMGDGHWSPQDLRWLDNILKKVSRTKRIFFVTHYPVDNEIDNWYEVISRMKKYNIQAFLVGHGHRNGLYNWEGIPGVMCRSTLRAGNRGTGYTIVEIAGDTIKFYEKFSKVNEKKYLYKIALGKKSYSKFKKYPRPDFSINKLYPQVKEKWIYNAGFTNCSSPAVDGNAVFVGDESGILHKLSLKKGKILGSFKTNGAVYSTPAIINNQVVFGSADSNIYCINAKTDRLIWKVKTGAAVLGSPSIDSGFVFIGGSDRNFRAINLTNGKIIWVFNGLKGFVETKPLVYKDNVIFGAWDSYLYCLNKFSGQLLWKWKGDENGMLYSPAAFFPVASNDIVFVVAPDRKLTALDVNTGKQLWRTGKYQVRESIGMSEDKTKFFVRTMKDSIIAFPISKTLPEPLWVTNAKFGYDINSAQLTEKDGVLFYGTKNGLLLALNSSTGKILWEHKIGVTIINTVNPLDSKRVLMNDLDGKTILIETEK